ncbi:hypothetical protein [Phenylobacterium ferrooxidans]|uniref:Uncharacterized protein n=1 Tax=Phenylobacterium ferrooxidans TaxID=2982689 RepID=A0ABW6CJT5_9CAUL
MGKLFEIVAGAKAYLIIAAICLALGAAGGSAAAWKIQDGNIASIQLEQKKAQGKAVAAAIKKERAAAKISAEAGRKAEDHQVEIRNVTRTIIREVPRYVSVEADARCVLPVGFLRVHDAATLGAPVSETLDPAGRPDDAAAGVDCSAAAAVIAENYGAYRSVSQQLIDLQDLVSDQVRLGEGAE